MRRGKLLAVPRLRRQALATLAPLGGMVVRLAMPLLAVVGAALVTSDAPVAQNAAIHEQATTEVDVHQAKFGGRGLTPRTGSRFGTGLAVSNDGNTVLIGAPGMYDNRGAAWIFTRRGQTWSSFRLIGTGQLGPARFGTGVALSANGKVALIGAPFDARQRGAAWVFTRSGPNWTGDPKLAGRDATTIARFGTSVALSANGRTALIGGPLDGRHSGGAAWSFMRVGPRWIQTGEKLSGSGNFGASLAVAPDGSKILIGAPQAKKGKGAAYFFAKEWHGPGATARPKPREFFGQRWWGKELTGGGGRFGFSVALLSDALIGAPLDGGGKGAAWFFDVGGLGFKWPRQKLTGAGGSFGSSVALPHGVPLIGAPNDLSGRGAAWRVSGRFGERLWARPTRLTVESPIGKAAIGSSVASSRGFMLIGGVNDDRRGGAWLFVENPPVVTAVSPNAGPTSGGTEVIVSGDNFTCARVVSGCAPVTVRRVLFGSTPAARAGGFSDSKIRVISPPGQPGGVHVTVLGTRGRSATSSADVFTYLRRPAVTAVAPASGPTGGGTEVTIAGADFMSVKGVTFGMTPAASFVVDSVKRIRAVAPPGQQGTVEITVTTAGGTSATGTSARFTYGTPAVSQFITFDDLDTGGPGGAGALVRVNSQYASQGVTFNDVSAIDYGKGDSALPDFARSGTVAVEQCVGVEFCATPIRAVFATPQRMVRVWVGFSFRLNQTVQVQLRALNAASAVVGTATATLPANPSPTPIGVPLEVRVATASITQLEVSIPGGFNNALAVDDVTFEVP